MKALKAIKAHITKLHKQFGNGQLCERPIQEFLKAQGLDDDDQIYDFIDGDAELVMVDGKLGTKPIEVKFYPTITNDNGWLSPDGKFYKCLFHGHSALARRITDDYNPESALEDEGYVKVQRRPWGDQTQWFFHSASSCMNPKLKPTGIQIKMVREFCAKHSIDDPYWSELVDVD
jgi:hypothetical protein